MCVWRQRKKKGTRAVAKREYQIELRLRCFPAWICLALREPLPSPPLSVDEPPSSAPPRPAATRGWQWGSLSCSLFCHFSSGGCLHARPLGCVAFFNCPPTRPSNCNPHLPVFPRFRALLSGSNLRESGLGESFFSLYIHWRSVEEAGLPTITLPLFVVAPMPFNGNQKGRKTFSTHNSLLVEEKSFRISMGIPVEIVSGRQAKT